MRLTRRLAVLFRLLLIAFLVAAVIIGFKYLAIPAIPIKLSQVPFPLIIFSLIGLLIVLYFIGSIKIINQGYEGLVERLGRYQRPLKPGLNFVIPILDLVLVELTREQILDIQPQSVITKDNVALEVDAVLFWKIFDVEKAYYGIDDLKAALENLVVTTLRSEVGKLELKQTFSSRYEINRAMLIQLDKSVAEWGAQVLRVEVQEISLSEELRDALEKEKAAESLRRAAVSQASGVVESIRLLKNALGDVDGKTIIHYLLAQEYIKTCERIGEGESSKVLFMDPKYLNESLSEFLNSKPNVPPIF